MQIKCMIGTYMYRGKLYRKDKVYVVSQEVGLDLLNRKDSFSRHYFKVVDSEPEMSMDDSLDTDVADAVPAKKRGRKPKAKKQVKSTAKKKVGTKKKDKESGQDEVNEAPLDPAKHKVKDVADPESNPTAPINQLPGDLDFDEDDSEAVEV